MTSCGRNPKRSGKYVFINFQLSGGSGKAFVDSGCTFNAISLRYAEMHGIPYQEMDQDLLITIGDDKQMRMKRRVARVLFDLGAVGTLDTYVFVMDVLPMQAQAIFGMDFLETVNPKIVWRTGAVTPGDIQGSGLQPKWIDEEAQFQHSMFVHRLEPFASQGGDTRVISIDEYERELATACESATFFILHPTPTEKEMRFRAQGWDQLATNPAYATLLKYKDTVFRDQLEVGKVKTEMEHNIDLTDRTPFHVPQFRLSPDQSRAIEAWAEEMLAARPILSSF